MKGLASLAAACASVLAIGAGTAGAATYDVTETAEIAQLTKTALATIRRVSQPHAFNVGLNLGSAAGGSLSGHLHQHVVPRWAGDANYLMVLAGTKMLPQLLGDTRDLLADAWDG